MSAAEPGFCKKKVINFQWILHNGNLSTEFPPTHILSISGPDIIKAVLLDILALDVGDSNEKITVEFLFEQEDLRLALNALIAGWNPKLIKKLCNFWCSKPNDSANASLQASHCSMDKCMYSPAEIFEAMSCVTVAPQCKCTCDTVGGGGATSATCDTTGMSDVRIVKKRKIDDQNYVVSKSSTGNASCHALHHKSHCTHECTSDVCYSAELEGKLVQNEISYYTRTSQHTGEHKRPSSNMPTLNSANTCTSSVEPNRKNPTSITMTPPTNIRHLLGFMRVFIHKFVPISLLGSSCNRRNLYASVKNLLSSGFKDDFYLGSLMSKMKVIDFKWAKSLGSVQDQQYVVAKLLVWIMQRMVLSVIRTFFYATESDAFGHLILYYPKNVWHHMVDVTLNRLQKHGSLQLQTSSKKSEKLGTTQMPAAHPEVRFNPKLSGMRPLYLLKANNWQESGTLEMKLLCSSLAKSFRTNCLIAQNKTSIADVWSDFVERLQNFAVPCAPLYVIKLDVSDAYGSVLHDVLLGVLKNFFAQLPSVVKYDVYSAIDDQDCLTERHYVMQDTKGNTPVREEPEQHWISMNSSIVVNVRRTAEAIEKYITSQVVFASKFRKYLVTKGIAQGGFLSSTLCEIYYLSMYCTHWKQFVGPKDVCMHSVDDFLFISAEKSSAERFLDVASKGVPQYNCYINPRKIVENVYINASPVRVPFCGLTFCSYSGQFLVSTASIVSVPPRYTLKITPKGNPVQFVIKRLQQITSARLRKEVLHPSYTSIEGLIANVYRVGVSVGARLEGLCGPVLMLKVEHTDARLIGSELVSIAGEVCKKINSLWIKKKGRGAPVTHVLIVATYLGGVGSVLCLKGHVLMPEVLQSITRLQDKFASQVSDSLRHLLPALQHKKKSVIAAARRHQ